MSAKKTATIPARLAWEDRWNEPTLKQLLEPQKDQQKKVLPELIEKVTDFEGVTYRMVWHGAAWKWTIQFDLADEKGKDLGALAYLVPNPERAVYCMPLRPETVEQLPLKRLNKFIREGIREAKCAVEIHWCIWTPSAQTEVEHLTDLVKRVHKIALGKVPGKSKKSKSASK